MAKGCRLEITVASHADMGLDAGFWQIANALVKHGAKASAVVQDPISTPDDIRSRSSLLVVAARELQSTEVPTRAMLLGAFAKHATASSCLCVCMCVSLSLYIYIYVYIYLIFLCLVFSI